MPRLLLLNLVDRDVDALTLVRELDPTPEIVVYHHDPNALAVRLARLADIRVVAVLPDPHPDDVVVCSENGGQETTMGWRDIGAPVFAPGDFDPNRWGETVAMPRVRTQVLETEIEPELELEPEPAVATRTETAENSAPGAAAPPSSPSPEPAPPRAVEPVREPESAPENRWTREPKSPAPETPRPVPETGRAPSPAEILASPEESFRWLVETSLGAHAEAVLWWDGNTGVWVPWVATGDLPAAREGAAPKGVEVQSEWGRFVLSSPGSAASVPGGALVRVCEDLALRDLTRWADTAPRIPSLARFDSAAAWFRAVSPFLDPEAALVWQSGQDAWALVAAEGAGIQFTGTVTLPGALLTATFETGASWQQWEPRAGLRVYLRFRDDDHRWPVRLKRLERLTR